MEQNGGDATERWENINPDQPVPIPKPEKKKSRALPIFLTLSNTVLSMGVGIAVGFFVFWYAIGPKSSGGGILQNLTGSEKPPAVQTAQATTGNVLAAHSDNVVVNTPQIGATVQNPVHIDGSVLLLNQKLAMRLRDSTGKVFLAKDISVNQNLSGEFTEFTATITYPKQPPQTHGTLEVFTKSNTNGRESDLLQIPIIFK